MPLVCKELHAAAHRHTALVNAVYLRLAGIRPGTWKERAPFFALCAKLMRRVLTDFARSRRSVKHDGSAARVPLGESSQVAQNPPADLVTLHEALERLEEFDERTNRVVELRFCAGLSVNETAEVLNVSAVTIHREWRLAKDWLFRELRNGRADES